MVNPGSIDTSAITSSPRLNHCAVPNEPSREWRSAQEASPPDSRRTFSQASTSVSSQRKAEPTRIAGGPSPRRRHARKHPTLTVRRSATCLIVSSRGVVPIECDCPMDFFNTPPVQMASRIRSRSRRAAFDPDPARAAASRADGQHWLRPSMLGTPCRDHPPRQQLSANTSATFDEMRLGRRPANVALRKPNTRICFSSSALRLVQPSGHAPLRLGYELTGDSLLSSCTVSHVQVRTNHAVYAVTLRSTP